MFVEVGERPPPGWLCLSFADKRFESPPDRRYPFPDWYTYYGPGLIGDQAAGAFQLGFLYDAKNDTQEVLGVAQVLSEDEALTYVWQGPPRGFVRFPIAIEEPTVLVHGVLYPVAGPTLGLHDDAALDSARHDVNGVPGHVFWSRGPWQQPAQDSWMTLGTTWQWNAVQTIEVAGERLHVPAVSNMSLGFDDVRDLQGESHWGQWRQGVRNGTLEGLHVSSLTPYMEFYYENKNINNAALTAAVDFLCRCPEVPLLSVDGVFCALGVAPPLLERGVVRHIRT